MRDNSSKCIVIVLFLTAFFFLSKCFNDSRYKKYHIDITIPIENNDTIFLSDTVESISDPYLMIKVWPKDKNVIYLVSPQIGVCNEHYEILNTINTIDINTIKYNHYELTE